MFGFAFVKSNEVGYSLM